MPLRRPTLRLQLSQEERETLERWVRRPTSAHALCLRAVLFWTVRGISDAAVERMLALTLKEPLPVTPPSYVSMKVCKRDYRRSRRDTTVATLRW